MLKSVYAAITLQTGIAAATFLVAKGALAALSPLELTSLRFLIAGALFAALLALSRKRLLPPKEHLPRAALLGLLGLPLNQGFFLFGLSFTTASHAALLYGLTPALVLLEGQLFLGERISSRKLAGIVAAFVGLVLVVFGRGLSLDAGTLKGDLLVLVAVGAWATYTVVMRPLAAEHGATTATGWAFLLGAAMSLPVLPFVVRAPSELAVVPPAAWGGLLYLAALSSVAAYLLWSFALRHLEPSKVAVFSNLQPVLGAALAWVFLGERMGALGIAGGALVIVGVRVSQRG